MNANVNETQREQDEQADFELVARRRSEPYTLECEKKIDEYTERRKSIDSERASGGDSERLVREEALSFAKLVIDTSSDSDSEPGSNPGSPDNVVKKALGLNDKVVMMSSDLKDLQRLLGSNESCLVCRAALDLIQSALVKTADIPIRDDAWFRVHHCSQPVHKTYCSAFRLPDWEYRNVHGKPSANFLKNLRRTVTACTMILNIADSGKFNLTNEEKKKGRHVVAGNPYIIYGCHMKDSEIGPLSGNENFFKKLYRLRTRCGFNNDFGYQSQVMFEGQGAQGEDADAADMFSEGAPGLRERLAELWESGKETLKNWAEKVVDLFFRAAGSVFGIVSSAFGRITDAIKSFCADMIKKMFNIEDLMNYCHTREFKLKVGASVIVFILLCVGVIFCLDWYFMRRISDGIVRGIVNMGFEEKLNYQEIENKAPKWVESHSKFYGQNQRADPVAAAVALGCLIWNIDGSKSFSIHKKASAAMDMMKLGSIVSCTTACVYSLMPVVLKESIACALETPTNRLKRECHEWCNTTNELGKLQQIPSVMACPLFREKVDYQIREGEEMLRKTTGPNFSDVRGYLTTNIVRLYQLSTVLTAMKNETLKRDEPFSMHVCGAPGVGKSLTIEMLLRRALEIEPHEIYSKNCGEDYWSGYYGQKAVIMDEFCVGSKEVRETVARQYLGVVSTSQTRLEMASLNDPRVGIKGTCFTSDVVVSINNKKYDRVEGIDETALWRRRNCVVDLQFDEENVRLDVEGKLDFNLYTSKEIFDAIWLKAFVYPNEPNRDGVEAPLNRNAMSFSTLCEYIKARHDRFRQKQEIIREAFGSVIDEKVDPYKIVENVFRRASGIPEHGQDSKSFFSEMFFGSLFGQGESVTPRIRHNHKCESCGEKRRHALLGKVYTCETCGEQSPCRVDGEERAEPDGNVFANDIAAASDSEAPCARRVKCVNFFCTKQGRLKSGEVLSKPWMCEPCVEKFQNPKNMVEINRSRMQKPIRKEIVHQDLESWNKAVMSELEEIPVRYWNEIVVPTAREYEFATRDFRGTWAKVAIPFRILGIGALILGAIKLRQMRMGLSDQPEEELTFGNNENTYLSQALYDRSTRTKARKSSLFAKRGVKGVKFEGQAGVQVNALRIKIGAAKLLCCPIGGKDLLIFHHSVVTSNGDVATGPLDMTLEVGKEVFEGTYTEDCVRSFPERDFMILRFNNPRLPNFKEITRFFLSRDEVDEFQGQCIVKVDAPRSEMYSRCDVRPASYLAHGQNYEIPKMVRYQCHTLNGDCGAPVVVGSGLNVGRILGIHVAGTGDPFNPQGLATLVAREDLEELRSLFDDEKSFRGQNMDSVENYNRMISEQELPNLISVTAIPSGRQMHLSNKSKLKPSLLSSYLNWEPKKAPAILDERDPRSKGFDPVDRAVKKLGEIPITEWDDDLKHKAKIAAMDMKVKYQRIIRNSGLMNGILTLDEAIGGVPGLIKSMDTSTCAGYPLGCTVRKAGKKSVIHHEDSVCKIDENFRKLCDQLEEDMYNYQGGPIDFAFQAFAKDELRSQKKLDNVDTRLTYANDVIFNSVVRKRTAVLMAALCKTFGEHGMAIALNPQSFDMNKIYMYLREVDKDGELGVIDGDFSEFDIRHTRFVILLVFRLVCDLMKDIEPSENFWNYVIEHEVNCGATVKNIHYKFVSILCSGSLFTTLFNCFVNELYFRVIFLTDYPHLSFDKEVRNVVLGDDHQISTSSLIEWTPKGLGMSFERLGLKYTSARKNEELREVRTPFGESLFLGSVPQRHHGLWSGALRKETLYESLLWTRNHDKSMDAEVIQMIEAASQWDEEFYDSYVSQIRAAYEQMGRKFPEPAGSWRGLGLSVANRTTESGADFPIYRAQAEGAIDAPKSDASAPGMTKITTDTNAGLTPFPQRSMKELSGNSLNEKPADLHFGSGSLMKRLTVTWSSTSTEGTSLISRLVPFGLLGLGDPQNLQNMPFNSFLYSVTDVRVVFQVNGTPTQAGMCIAYHTPLLNLTPDRSSKPSYNHTWLTPHQNTTSELKINFRYWRSALNATNAAYFPEVLGCVKVDVFSPLVSLNASTCDITMYVAFDADFKVPRPIPIAPTNGVAPSFGFSKNSDGTLNAAPGTYVGQGSNVSTTNVNTTYTVGDVGGDMPIQAGVDGGGRLTQDGKADLSVPMDNPPVAGGAIPIVGQFSSMSKTNGVEITTALQLHQKEMSYQPVHFHDPLDTSISEMCGKQGYLTKFSWSTTDLAVANKLTLKLDSTFDYLGSSSGGALPYWNSINQLPVNVAVLNQFNFWRGDIVFDVCVVKTPFHSGRLMASVCYGNDTINTTELNVYMNHVLDFNGDVAWNSFRVNYNNSQEFLRTNNGRGVARSRDQSIGCVGFTVLNELRATSEVVSSSVEVLIFVRFENVRVAVPKPNPRVQFGNDATVYHAQGQNVIEVTPDEQDEGPTDVVDTTAATAGPPANRACKLTFGEKFDYCVADAHELVRRHIPLSLKGTIRTVNGTTTYVAPWYLDKYEIKDTVGSSAAYYDVYRIAVQPISDWNRVYAGWSGHMKYRVFVYGSAPGLIWYTPQDYSPSFETKDDFADVVLGSADSYYLTSGNDTGTERLAAPYYMPNIAREMTYPYTSNCSMLDVSVPFCTQYNFLPLQERAEHLPDASANWGNGYLYIRVAKNTRIEVFHAAGDDFRYHVFCPRHGIRSRILDKYGTTSYTFSAGDRIAGLHAG